MCVLAYCVLRFACQPSASGVVVGGLAYCVLRFACQPRASGVVVGGLAHCVLRSVCSSVAVVVVLPLPGRKVCALRIAFAYCVSRPWVAVCASLRIAYCVCVLRIEALGGCGRPCVLRIAFAYCVSRPWVAVAALAYCVLRLRIAFRGRG